MKRKWAWWLVAAALIVIVIGACVFFFRRPEVTSFPGDQGIRWQSRSGLTVTVPPLTDTSEITLSFSTIRHKECPELWPVSFSHIHSISLSSETLSEPPKITITFPLTPDQCPDNMLIIHKPDEQWRVMPGEVTTDDQGITIKTSHSTEFALATINPINSIPPTVTASDPIINGYGDLVQTVTLQTNGDVDDRIGHPWWQVMIHTNHGLKTIEWDHTKLSLSIADFRSNCISSRCSQQVDLIFRGTGGAVRFEVSTAGSHALVMAGLDIADHLLTGKNRCWQRVVADKDERSLFKRLQQQLMNRCVDIDRMSATEIINAVTQAICDWAQAEDLEQIATRLGSGIPVVDAAASGLLATALRQEAIVIDVTASPPDFTLEIDPETVRVAPGESIRFHGHFRTMDGTQLSGTPSWSVSGGGTIDSTGLFVSHDNTEGHFRVSAVLSSSDGTQTFAEATATVSVGRRWDDAFILVDSSGNVHVVRNGYLWVLDKHDGAFVIFGNKDVVDAVNKDGHWVVLKEDGTVWTMGINNYGQLGAPASSMREEFAKVVGLTDVCAVAAGQIQSVVLKTDGTVWAWGGNECFGELGDGTETSRHVPAPVVNLSDVCLISACVTNGVAVRADGTVWIWGNEDFVSFDETKVARVPVPVEGLEDVRSVATGEAHILVLKKDGTVWAWGHNVWGVLGDGTTEDRNDPVQVVGLSNIVQIAAGKRHSMALRDDGTVWTWGNGHALGERGDADNLLPARVVDVDDVQLIAAGRYTSAIVKRDGSVWVWGYGPWGEWDHHGELYRDNKPSRTPVYLVNLLVLGLS